MEDLHKQVLNLQFKIRDLMDEPDHSAARHLNTEVQGLEDDLEVQKNARTIEDRVKRIIHILEGEAKDARIMNYEHLDLLVNEFEHIQNKLRSLQ